MKKTGDGLVAQMVDNALGVEVERAMDELEPRVLPPGWRKFGDFSNARQYASLEGLGVFQEVEVHDGELWLHVSFSRRDRVPSYADTKFVKDLFVGRNRKAIQVLPAETEHVNVMPNCLHLFCPLGSDPLPDFRRDDGGL